MVKLRWETDARLNPQSAGLPKKRGSAVVFFGSDTIAPLSRYPKGYFAHFSWDGKSFRLRNFLAGQTAAQDGNITASDVYEAGSRHLQCVGELHVPYTDSAFWLQKLAALTEEVYEREGWKLGRE